MEINIYEAGKSIFNNEFTHLMCFKHLLDAISRNFAEMGIKKEDIEPIKDNVRQMQSMITLSNYNKNVKMFKEENKQYDNFIKYLDETYFNGIRKNWPFLEFL